MSLLIKARNLEKQYGQQKVVDHLSFDVHSKEFLTLLGPSGCGKTTTLRMIGGFETPDAGTILLENRPLGDLPPYQRPINTVFQKYALFPHMNVYENIAFGLKIKKMKGQEIKKRVARMLDLLSLSGFEKRSVQSLSGGQQQRIAIARALVNQPKVLLLDEPLGALDLKLRKNMQLELKNMQQELGITFIYVTHDQEEALTMSDTIMVMNHGQIQQIGSPLDIYNEPKNVFVAEFIGESNIFDGRFIQDFSVCFADHNFKCVDKGFTPGEDIDVVIRPEDIKLTDVTTAPLQGIVRSVVFKGVHYEILIEENNRQWLVHSTSFQENGARLGLTIDPYDIHLMKKGSDHVS